MHAGHADAESGVWGWPEGRERDWLEVGKVGKTETSAIVSTIKIRKKIIKYSIGNLINNIVTTMYGARCVLKISREHFVKNVIVQPLCCTPEANAK